MDPMKRTKYKTDIDLNTALNNSTVALKKQRVVEQSLTDVMLIVEDMQKTLQSLIAPVDDSIIKANVFESRIGILESKLSDVCESFGMSRTCDTTSNVRSRRRRKKTI